MTKLKALWYLSEAFLLAIWIVFFTVIFGNLWAGIIAGILAIAFTEWRTNIFNKVKVKNEVTKM
jgi:MFS superfamily sulfate permease-like transporter